MPDAKLPSSPAGWLVAIAASLIGLLAGLITIRTLSGMFGG